MKNVLFVSLVFISSVGLAKDFTITQKDKMFDQKEVTLKIGDTIKFVNGDPTTHHLLFKKDGERISKKQASDSDPILVTFEQEQETTVRCAIHPKMKLKVKVVK